MFPPASVRGMNFNGHTIFGEKLLFQPIDLLEYMTLTLIEKTNIKIKSPTKDSIGA